MLPQVALLLFRRRERSGREADVGRGGRLKGCARGRWAEAADRRGARPIPAARRQVRRDGVRRDGVRRDGVRRDGVSGGARGVESGAARGQVRLWNNLREPS